VATAQRPRAADHAVDINIEAGKELTVMGDADRLGQVMANLVENAMKFARANVWVGARADTGWAVIWVDDDGPGIAPADLPHVFERLYVAQHQPTRAENSSGLGLAIVAELVSAMGGRVEAQVAPNGGARMVVRLPLVP
jgi:signal transduction histidine kinase